MQVPGFSGAEPLPFDGERLEFSRGRDGFDAPAPGQAAFWGLDNPAEEPPPLLPLHPAPPGGSEKAMKWVVYKEIYTDRLETRYPTSAHTSQVRRVLDRFTKYCNLLSRNMDKITSLDIEAYLKRRRLDVFRDKPVCNRTLNNELQILNTAFNYAGPPEPWGRRRKNLGVIQIVPYVEPLEEDVFNPISLTPPQFKAVIAATSFARAPRLEGCDPQKFWTTAILLGLISSLRRGGLLRIPRPDDYTLFHRQMIVLPPDLSKTRTEQFISLGNAQVVEIVASLPTQAGEPLLPWKAQDGHPMTLSHFNAVMCEFQRLAGIPENQRVKPKHLRSTAATECLEQFGESVAKSKLGHSANSNTINTNYKSRRIGQKDQEASEHLAGMVLPLLYPGHQLDLFEGERA